jgi:2-polyprenyl-6-methoxyphenol hydroxylase-like FAD-dependent oxidoreductase
VHAIVVGASIAGLAAARVLSERFERVTVIDRDMLPVQYVDRPGVPQGRHGHGLLASGLRALERLFPDLGTDLIAAGAIRGDVIGNVRWFQHGRYKAQFDSGLTGFLMSRALLEGAIRSRVRQLRNVRIVEGCHVLGIVADAAGARIVGVRTRPDLAEDGHIADLIVDASGRASRTPACLREIGYEAPGVEKIDIDLTYATRQFIRKSGDLGGDSAAVIAATPPDGKRLGFILATERDRWMVTLGGVLGEGVPADENGYSDFARSLECPDIYNVIRHSAPLTDVVHFRFSANLRHRYDRLRRFPERYLVLGDGLCSFNPVYGQGMSVAVLEALDLEACLAEPEGLHRLWRRMFRRTAGIIDRAWMLAAGSDLAYPTVVGRRRFLSTPTNWYLDQVHAAGATDHVVCRTFFDVAGLLAPPTALVHPGIVARIARHACAGFWRRRRRHRQ